MNENIKSQLEDAGYDYAVAVATEDEVRNGAACGQLSIIVDSIDDDEEDDERDWDEDDYDEWDDDDDYIEEDDDFGK